MAGTTGTLVVFWIELYFERVVFRLKKAFWRERPRIQERGFAGLRKSIRPFVRTSKSSDR